MPLIKDGRIVTDNFVCALEGQPLPAGGPVLLTADRMLADMANIADRDRQIGVIWPNNRSVAELGPYLDRFAMVGLVFPTFRDGRAYTQARLLRDRYGFGGEIRATGQILRDQFLFLSRAGFNAFEVKKDADAEAFLRTVDRYTVFYQPASDQRETVFSLRRSRPFG